MKCPNGTASKSQCGIRVLVRVTLTIRVFIDVSSRRATGFHKLAKIFGVNFFIGKTFH